MSHFTDKDEIQSILPSQGWLSDYVSFTDGLEACPRFRFFTACCVLGAALNNKVYIYRGDEELLPKLFPNPWVMLLAPPGRGHKTSTINLGMNCLYQACPEVRLIADKITPESLVQALSTPTSKGEKISIGPCDATGLIKAPELSVFFGKQQYNAGLITLITDLYDYREEWVAETIGRGKNVLKNICVSILGGSTPTWLQKMLPEDAFTGGFMSRFIIVEMPQSYLRRVAFPTRKKSVSAKNWSKLTEGLHEIATMHEGEMFWTQDCAASFEEYYNSLLPTGDVQKDAYREREPEQVLRLAMLLALSRREMSVTLPDLQRAKQLIDLLMNETNPRIDYLTTNPRMSLTQDIQNLLRLHGPLTEAELMKKTYRGLTYGEAQFYEAVHVLKYTQVVEVKPQKNGAPLIVLRKEAKDEMVESRR